MRIPKTIPTREPKKTNSIIGIRSQRFILLAILLGGMIFSFAHIAESQGSPQEIAADSLPAVVLITLEGESGTGSIIHPDGCIITATHVLGIENPPSIVVRLADGTVYENDEVQIVSFDTKNDISIIRVNGNDLPWIPIGDSETVRELDPVVTIGYPRPDVLPTDVPTSDTGSIQAIHEEPVGMQYGFPPKTIELERAIRVSGTIRPGSSGGPVLNSSGEIISIISMVPRQSALSTTAYSSPINRAPAPRECTINSAGSFPVNFVLIMILALVIVGSIGIWSKKKSKKVDSFALLRSAALFKDLGDSELKDLRKKCVEKSFKKDEKLIRQGELDQLELFYIIDGQVGVYIDGHEVARRGRGRVLGETALIENEPRTGDVIALEQTTCLVLSKDDLRELISEKPDIGMKLMADLTKRLREALSKA